MTDIKDWDNGPLRSKRDTREKVTMSDYYYFYENKSSNKEDNTKIIVSGIEEDSHLIQAEIYSSFIILPNGISIGMSTVDVVGVYSFKEEPTYPEKLIVSGENSKIEYTFMNQTLVKVIIYAWKD
jgi:hypothetical protein